MRKGGHERVKCERMMGRFAGRRLRATMPPSRSERDACLVVDRKRCEEEHLFSRERQSARPQTAASWSQIGPSAAPPQHSWPRAPFRRTWRGLRPPGVGVRTDRSDEGAGIFRSLSSAWFGVGKSSLTIRRHRDRLEFRFKLGPLLVPFLLAGLVVFQPAATRRRPERHSGSL